jgi:hypothetical protein
MQETTKKKCSGCKNNKEIENFYKNKLTSDGHSNYCIDCTRENSKRYFQRKKERQSQIENDNLMKLTLLNGYSTDGDDNNADSLMKILLIERMCSNVLTELQTLKKNYIRIETPVSQ